MRNYLVFEPDRGAGVVFQILAMLLLLGVSGWGIWQAVHSSIGPVFLMYLIPALLSTVFVPLLAYRLYSLMGAYYQIERDGMRLRWGLRIEDIPMDHLVWISPSEELERRLPLPWLRWPGAVLGSRHTAQNETIEFFASRSRRLVVIATHEKVYAISPSPPEIFVQNLRSFMELGSLSPVPARSIQPTFLLNRIWRQRSARSLILAGLALNLALLVWVSVAIPARPSILLGFASANEPLPAVRLLLLPVINGFFFLVDLFLGFFFYRRAADPPADESRDLVENPLLATGTGEGSRTERMMKTLNQDFWSVRRGMSLVPGQYLAHLLWGSSVLTSILFLLATYFILSYST